MSLLRFNLPAIKEDNHNFSAGLLPEVKLMCIKCLDASILDNL